jgi:hypothetical protein
MLTFGPMIDSELSRFILCRYGLRGEAAYLRMRPLSRHSVQSKFLRVASSRLSKTRRRWVVL